jgi:hypothetical protein
MTTSASGVFCPKCGRARATGVESCPRCGLVFARWKPPAPVGAADGFLDTKGEKLWGELDEHWSDEARHQAFLKHCAAAGCLAAAGRRYRQRLDDHPEDGVAGRMQARIVAMVAATLTPTAAPPAPVNRQRWLLVLAGVAALGGAVGGLLYRRFRR